MKKHTVVTVQILLFITECTLIGAGWAFWWAYFRPMEQNPSFGLLWGWIGFPIAIGAAVLGGNIAQVLAALLTFLLIKCLPPEWRPPYMTKSMKKRRWQNMPGKQRVTHIVQPPPIDVPKENNTLAWICAVVASVFSFPIISWLVGYFFATTKLWPALAEAFVMKSPSIFSFFYSILLMQFAFTTISEFFSITFLLTMNVLIFFVPNYLVGRIVYLYVKNLKTSEPESYGAVTRQWLTEAAVLLLAVLLGIAVLFAFNWAGSFFTEAFTLLYWIILMLAVHAASLSGCLAYVFIFNFMNNMHFGKRRLGF